jgi:metal-sulfur cluster biosynthetic enzyme
MSGGSGVVHRIVARILRKRNDPHGKLIVDPSILKGVEIDNSGIVELWIKPSNPHCPCCLDDLIDLRSLLKKQRGVLACHIEIVGIPQSDRWTAAINE